MATIAVGAANSLESTSNVDSRTTATAIHGHTLIELTPNTTCDVADTLEQAGARLISSTLQLYRLNDVAAAAVLPRIRFCHAMRFAIPDRPAGTLSVTDSTDPLLPTEWWRAAIGVTDLTPPGPGKPVTIVDSGVDAPTPSSSAVLISLR